MYVVRGNFAATLELVKLLPKNFTINSSLNHFKINKQWLTIISEYFQHLFSDFELSEIDLPADKYLDKLIYFLDVGEYKSDDLTDVLELLLLIKKYLIKDVDLVKTLDNLTIPPNLFHLYIEYLERLFDYNLIQAVDLIAKHIKPNTDLSLFQPSILELINASPYKRHYGTGKMTLLIKKLEEIANQEKEKPLKQYIFEAYDLLRQHPLTHLNLSLIYQTHSVAEAVLKFRDYILYSTTHSIKSKKYLDYIDPDNHSVCSSLVPETKLKEKDIFRSYELRYLSLMHREVDYFSQGSIEEVEKKINGMIMLGGFRIIELK